MRRYSSTLRAESALGKPLRPGEAVFSGHPGWDLAIFSKRPHFAERP
jgi:hypothetical protein